MTELNTVTIAGLLHDFGKIVQRATGEKEKHELLGFEALEELNLKIPGRDKVFECVRYHHVQSIATANLPANSLAYLIYEADNIAAGIDRKKRLEQYEHGMDLYRPLETVFNLLGENANRENLVYALEMLDERKNINYPRAKTAEAVNKQHYEWIMRKIKEVLQRMDLNYDSIDSLLKLLEATTCYVPSSTLPEEINDIPLYDHLKLTAAIAACMYSYFAEQKIEDYKKHCFSNSSWRDEKVFILVSGDISGIQNFIYTVSSRGALRSLRARSFYLEFLLENIVDEILQTFGLSRANLLYTGGGHFYLLLPATEMVQRKLSEFVVNFNDWLMQNYGLSIYLNIAWESCSANELKGESERNTGDLFKILSSKLARAKLRRYSTEQLQELFSPASQVNQSRDAGRECVICHTSTAEITTQNLFDDSLDVCANCSSLLDIGGKLIQSSKKNNQDRMLILQDEKKDGSCLKVPTVDGKTRFAYLTTN